jgi:hypothetical protein
MKPTEQWFKTLIIILKVIFAIPYGVLTIALLLLGCIAWFLSLGHLHDYAFAPAFFIGALYNSDRYYL